MFARLFFCLMFLSVIACASAATKPHVKTIYAQKSPKDYQEYVNYFEKVYKTFEDHYYLEPNRKIYNDFLEKFRTKIYAQLKGEGKSNDYVKWRSAWILVDELKSKEDRFSQLYPPKPAEKFQKEVMGQVMDLGIEGKKVDAGYMITHIEPRSDAYEKGLREEDVLLRLDRSTLKDLTAEEIKKALSPLINTTVNIGYMSAETKHEKDVTIVSKEYFKQTVFLRPVQVPGVYCLEITQFGRTSGDDLTVLLKYIEKFQPRGLVIDLRGNPGGPPLAALQMAAFFLKGGEEFAHFQRRGEGPMALDVPVIDEQFKFNGPMAVLVDHDSGSAAELFPGILQFRKRAIVLGVNSAGYVLLKSMFPLEDGSMVALVTAPGYYPDGTRFSFNGITPDQVITDAPKEGLINLAAAILIMKRNK